MTKKPSVILSLLPIVFLIVELFFVVRFFGSDALDGASQLALIFASGFAIALSILVCKGTWHELETSIADNIRSVGNALLILLLIGMISGSWMVSGVVPMMICAGLKVITPKLFLLAVCLVSALVSIITGSSWTTIATIGVAFSGIGLALGFSPGWTAGAIISGAYFGDKISPLSDTTVLASSSAGTPLFEHIRYMMITTIPSFVIACIIFLVSSLLHNVEGSTSSADIIQALGSTFNLSPWLILVPLATIVMILLRIPAFITLMGSALIAGIAALVFQPGIVASIADADALTFRSGFMGIAQCYYGTTSIQTGLDTLDALIGTSGMNGMVPTIILIISASVFGGVMTGSGMIRTLTEALVRHVTSCSGTVAATVFSGIFANMVTGDQYLSILLTASLYKDLYKKNGLESRLLSRSAEDSATVTSVLIPWNSCGMTQSTVLKIPTVEFLPYCFFNLISPLMSILIALVGYKIVRKKTDE